MSDAHSQTTANIAIRVEIEQALEGFFRERISTARTYGESFERLWQHASEHVLGGKLLRPLLFAQTHGSLVDTYAPGASLPTGDSGVVQMAVAIEVLHFSFLLHDDVIDGDSTRRGKPNLIGALRGEGVGSDGAGFGLDLANTGAILMGNLLLTQVHQIVARIRIDRERRERLLDLLEHTITETVAGEYLDVGLSRGSVPNTLATILDMSRYKTATYSFELPLRAGAILGGAPQVVESTLVRAGQYLGLAFQLQDDLLSIFGKPNDHGKVPFADLRAGKETAAIAFARLTSAWPEIEPHFGRGDLDSREAQLVQRLLRRCGAERFVQGLVDAQLQYFRDACSLGDKAVPDRARAILLDLASRLEGRQT